MKKEFIIKILLLFLLYFLSAGCTKRIDVKVPLQDNIDGAKAYEIITTTVHKYSPVDGLTYVNMLSSGDSTRVVHVWKNTKNRAYYIRYWSFDGDNLRVEFQKNNSSSRYYVALRNNGADSGDCYGYSHSLPVSKGMRFDIYWSNIYKQGCKNVIRYSFNNEDEALLFAGALQYMFVDHKADDILYNLNNSELVKDEKIIEKNKKPMKKSTAVIQPKSTSPDCSVDKILQMQNIGLSTDEIKKICK